MVDGPATSKAVPFSSELSTINYQPSTNKELDVQLRATGRMAGSYCLCRSGLLRNAPVPCSGTIWSNQSDAASRRVHLGEYRGRQLSILPPGFLPVRRDRHGFCL